MSATADLIIRVVADTSAAKKPLDDSASRVDKVGKTLNKLALPAAAVVAGIAAFGKAAVDSASRTQQAMGALDSVFGRNAGQVKAWAANAATAVGLSQSQYGELASTIGAQLKNLGIPFDQVAGRTKTMIGLGADLAATFGGTTADAVEALSATMRGETDPIERYGVSIKQATIDAELARTGADKLTGAAAKQARTMATLSLISKQTADAHGQFARESDSAAGSAQIATAQMENFKSTMGTALLPVVAAVSAALGRFAAFAQKNSTTVQILIGIVLAFSVAILVLVAALKVYTIYTEIAALAAEHAWIAALGPIGLVILAVIAVIAIVVILWKKSQTFRKIVTAVWSAIKVSALAVGRAIQAAWKVVWAALSASVKAFVLVFKVAFNLIRAVTSVVASFLRSAWRAVWSTLTDLVRSHVAAFRSIFDAITGVASNVANAVQNAWRPVWAALTSAAKAAGKVLSAPFDVVKSAIEAVIHAVESLINALSRIHVPKINLPNLPGPLGALTRAVTVPAPSDALGRFAAPGVGATARVGVPGGGGGLTVIVNGALDPEAVARQINRIVGGHDRRIGAARRTP